MHAILRKNTSEKWQDIERVIRQWRAAPNLPKPGVQRRSVVPQEEVGHLLRGQQLAAVQGSAAHPGVDDQQPVEVCQHGRQAPSCRTP